MNSIPTYSVQVDEGSVECNRDCVICGSVGMVCELEWVQGVWDDGVNVSLSKHFMAIDMSATGDSHLGRLPLLLYYYLYYLGILGHR
jgi:hypothetical protein